MTTTTRRTIALQAAIWRASYDRTLPIVLVEQLHELAGGNTTVLAEAVGLTAGAWTITAGTGSHQAVLAAALKQLYIDGLDPWLQLGAARASVPRYAADARRSRATH